MSLPQKFRMPLVLLCSILNLSHFFLGIRTLWLSWCLCVVFGFFRFFFLSFSFALFFLSLSFSFLHWHVQRFPRWSYTQASLASLGSFPSYFFKFYMHIFCVRPVAGTLLPTVVIHVFPFPFFPQQVVYEPWSRPLLVNQS